MESETEATMRGRRGGVGPAEKKRKVMRGRRIVPRINGDVERGIEKLEQSSFL